MTLNRAYSVLDIKSFNDEQRIIEGVASTPTADRVGDVVMPRGAKYSLPLPMLWQHKSGEPIGHVVWAESRDEGIPFRAKIAQSTEPGKLKDRLDEAWQSIKLGLVRAVSIGFKPVADKITHLKGGGLQYDEYEILEVSAVTIPANAEASIHTIRSIDQGLRAASGDTQPALPASSGHQPAAVAVSRSLKLEARTMATTTNAERMKQLEARRAAVMAARDAIQSKITEEDRTKDEAEVIEFDEHQSKITSIDRELRDCRTIEKELIANARPVTSDDGVAMHSSVIQVKAPTLEPGIGLMKLLHCQAYARENHRDVIAVAREHCGQWPQIENALRTKAAVAYGTTTGATWAAPLVYAQNLTSEFVNYLLPMTFFGKIQGLTRVPFNSRVVRDTAAISAQWVGEGESKPVAAGAFDTVTLAFNKIALIIGVTQELARYSTPAVEMWAREKLAEAIAQFQDQQFITPSVTAITGSRPASITNGADSDAASGTASTDLIHDIRQIIKHFQDFNISTANLVLLMQPQLATAIGSIYTTLGIQQFPTVNGDGGNVTGIQVITSGNVPSGYVVALNPPSIAVADDGGLEISASTEASVEMDDNPTSGNWHLISAFQNNLLLVRAERFITWKRLRDKGVFYLTNCAYGGAVT
jgi:HK97 family phage major capsid protein/HK97 family phage prohead protease